MALKIERIYAFVAIDDDGDEGIMAFQDPGTAVMMPMIGADMKRVDQLTKIADNFKKVAGIEYKIKYYELAEDH